MPTDLRKRHANLDSLPGGRAFHAATSQAMAVAVRYSDEHLPLPCPQVAERQILDNGPGLKRLVLSPVTREGLLAVDAQFSAASYSPLVTAAAKRWA